jgi:hypothetical protein
MRKIIMTGKKENIEKPESIIEFPGGSISVCRTSNNEYWAHIEVNDKQKVDDIERESKIGAIKKIRYDGKNGAEVLDIKTNHFAVLICTE